MTTRIVCVLVAMTFPVMLAGCGASLPCSATETSSLGIGGDGTQLIHTADHAAAAPGNQVKFTATAAPGNTNAACPVATYIAVVNAQWTSSDPNVTVSSANDYATNGLAVCVGTTLLPATLTAAVPGAAKTASIQLMCK